MARRDFGAASGLERPGRLALIGLLVLPLLVGGILAWALATPASNLQRITTAIVNEDEPVTIDGKSIPLGRQFAAGLLAAQEPAPPAEVPGPTSSPAPSGPTASATPSAGSVEAAAPADASGVQPTPSFTWVLTNAADAASGLASGRYAAVLTIPKSFSADATSYSGPAQHARQAKLTVQTTPASAWLDPALIAAVSGEATAALNRQLTQNYLANVYQGFNTLNEQIGGAASGAQQLSAGAAQTDTGAQQVSSGAADLSSGLAQVAAGAASLSSGLDRLAASSASLPKDTATLASVSSEVSGGVSTLASGLDGAATTLRDVRDRVCASPGPGPACTAAQQAYDAVAKLAGQTDVLAEGAAGVAKGNAALAQAMPSLVSGIDSAANGSTQVASGAGQSSTGSTTLASGAAQVANGTAQVTTGAEQLSRGLDSAVNQIPTYSPSDITALTAIVAQPVTVSQDSIGPGMQSAPLFAALALWIGGLAAALAFPAVPPRRLLTSTASLRIAGAAAAPVLAVGAGQGLIVALAVLGSVSATPLPWLAFTGGAVFFGAVSALVNLALAAAFGGVGRLVSAAMFLVAMAAGLSATVPPVIAGLAAPLPPTQGLDLLRATLTGATLDGWGAFAFLALTAVAAFALAFAGVATRRRVRVRGA